MAPENNLKKIQRFFYNSAVKILSGYLLIVLCIFLLYAIFNRGVNIFSSRHQLLQ